MFSDTVINSEAHMGIIKTDISDKFPIFSNLRNGIRQEEKIKRSNFNSVIAVVTIEQFQQNLRCVYWNELKMLKDANPAYDHFLRRFISLCDNPFPKDEVKAKRKIDFNY